MIPKSEIKKSDNILKWKDFNNTEFAIPCSVESVFYEEMRDGQYFYTPRGNVQVLVQLNNETKTIFVGQRFLFGSSAYEVGGVDDLTNVENDKGFLTFFLERTEKLTDDDFINGIASNSYNTDDDGSNDGGGWL
jgi:hypothetical protein